MRLLFGCMIVALAGCSGGKDTASCGDDGSGNALDVDGGWYSWSFTERKPVPTSCDEPEVGQFVVTCSGDTIAVEVAYISASYDSDGDANEKAGSVSVRLGGELAEGNNDTLGSSTSGVSINHEGATGLGPTSAEAYSSAISLSAYSAGASADGAFVATWLDAGEIIAEVGGGFTVSCP